MEAVIRRLGAEVIDRALFRSFVRRQVVNDCLRREAGEWVVRADPFIDDWSEADYAEKFPLPAFPPFLTKEGVVVMYQQYEIAPYAVGMPSCVIKKP